MIGTLLLIISLLTFLYVKKKHQYFSDKGIPSASGYFPLGSSIIWKCFTGQQSILQVAEDLNDDFPKSKAFGFYKAFGEPVLVLKDLELARRIMVKDFEHFIDRSFLNIHPEANKYTGLFLVNIKGEHWRSIRNLLTPMFTSSKLKSIMPLLHTNAENLTQYLEEKAKSTDPNIDCKDTFQRLTIENLGNLGCGFQANVLNGDEDNIFYKQAMILSGSAAPPVISVLKFVFSLVFPNAAYHMRVNPLDEGSFNFFVGIVRKSMVDRKNNNFRRNDFIDLMLDSVKEMEVENDSSNSQIFTDEDIEAFIVSNALMLFFVGNDTTSGALSLIMLNLALHQDVQEKLYNEIKDAVDDNNGDINLDFNILSNLRLMEKVIKESVRLWGINFFDRTCTKEYFIPELNFTVPKGMHVTIAGGKIMQDEKNFPNPLDFDPEGHFDSDTFFVPNFLGFGQGPRQCIGMRLAYTMMRTAMVHTLYNFKVVPGPKTKKEWTFHARVPGGIDKDNIFVRLEKRDN